MKKIFFALITLFGLIACEQEPNVTLQKTLKLSADKSEIVANGTESVTFTVKDANDAEVTGATIYFADTNEAIEGNTFKTSVAGSYTFYAVKGNNKSNNLSITAKTATNNEGGNEDDNNDGTGDDGSDDGTDDGKDDGNTDPIELSASTTTIKANGVDNATFTAKQSGVEVTTKVTIYVNGGKLQSNRFATTTPGTYTVYAEKGSVKSNEITITAEEVTATGKTIVFAEGVTLTSGWYDVNKYKAGDNGDIQMCWAASASNIIQWWQDRYVAQGGTLPSTAVSGASSKTYSTGCKYELALMDVFHSEWDNSLGGHVDQAIPWYFEGSLNGGEYASPGSQATPKSDGGYWKSLWSDIVSQMYCGYDYFSFDTFDTAYTYTVDYNNYQLWGNGSSLEGVDRLSYFSNLVVEAFKYGMASLTVSLASDIYSLHHATTLWGYEIDNATGLLTRVWLTDSDDLTGANKTPILHEYAVSIGEGKSHIKLTCDSVRYAGGNVWVVGIVPVSGPNSANK